MYDTRSNVGNYSRTKEKGITFWLFLVFYTQNYFPICLDTKIYTVMFLRMQYTMATEILLMN